MQEMKDTRVTLLAAPSDLAALDGWRRAHPDLPNRSEAIRRLIHLGIRAEPLMRDLLRLIEHLQEVGAADEALAKNAQEIKDALGIA